MAHWALRLWLLGFRVRLSGLSQSGLHLEEPVGEALLQLLALVLHVDHLGRAVVLDIGQARVQVEWIVEKRLGVLRLQRHLMVQIVLRVGQTLHEILEWSITEAPLVFLEERV